MATSQRVHSFDTWAFDWQRRRANEHGIWVREHVPLLTPRPQVVSDLFEHFSVIDYHDRLIASGVLAVGDCVGYHHKWWHRLFATLLGMIVTDAYLAFRLDHKRDNHGNMDNCIPFFTFVERLAKQLIENELDGPANNTRKRRNRAPEDEERTNYVSIVAWDCCLWH